MNLNEPCVNFQGYLNKAGYGQASFGRKSFGTRKAHRIAWMREYGAISDEEQVLHACDNPACVNVEHMFLGTPLDNMRDKVAKGRYRNGRQLPAHVVAMVRGSDLSANGAKSEMARKINRPPSTITRILNGESY